MKLGVLLAGRRPDDVAARMEQAREAGFSLCQLNLLQTGFTRADLAAIADAMLEYGVRPVAVGCYINPLRPDDPSLMGTCRADLDLLLHSLDIIGARRIVFWSGTQAETPYDEHPDNAAEDTVYALRDFLTDIVRETKARHYTLVLEPWRSHVLGTEERIIAFHGGLEPSVSGHVRYVLDAPNLITEERYPERDACARTICRAIGEAAGVVHLRDCIMPPDGEAAPPDAPAIVRNVPAAEYAQARDYLLRLTDRWELA